MPGLPRSERLRGKENIGRLFSVGGKGAQGEVAARAVANALDHARLAAVAGKKLGKAVKRNRMRRRLRAAFRLHKEQLPKGFDLALIARPGLLEASWTEIVSAVLKAVEKAASGRDRGRPRRLPKT